jgi:preprotein translocase subunit SecE
MGVRISPPVQRKILIRTLKLVRKMSIRTYIEETTTELVQKTSWPTWKELQESAVVVLIASAMIAIVIFLMDSGFKKLMELAYQLLNNL